MKTYGKYQDSKCVCCETSVATTIYNGQPMCIKCVSEQYRRTHPRIARSNLIGAQTAGKCHG